MFIRLLQISLAFIDDLFTPFPLFLLFHYLSQFLVRCLPTFSQLFDLLLLILSSIFFVLDIVYFICKNSIKNVSSLCLTSVLYFLEHMVCNYDNCIHEFLIGVVSVSVCID